MYRQIAQLLMYGELDEDSILYKMGDIFARFDSGQYEKMELIIGNLVTEEEHAVFEQLSIF